MRRHEDAIELARRLAWALSSVPERFASARRMAKTAGRESLESGLPAIGSEQADENRRPAPERRQAGGVLMRKIAFAAAMIGVLLASVAQAGEDPKAQKRRDARQIDEQYQQATKGSSWAVSPKPLADPWQTVKSPPPPEKK